MVILLRSGESVGAGGYFVVGVAGNLQQPKDLSGDSVVLPEAGSVETWTGETGRTRRAGHRWAEQEPARVDGSILPDGPATPVGEQLATDGELRARVDELTFAVEAVRR